MTSPPIPAAVIKPTRTTTAPPPYTPSRNLPRRRSTWLSPSRGSTPLSFIIAATSSAILFLFSVILPLLSGIVTYKLKDRLASPTPLNLDTRQCQKQNCDPFDIACSLASNCWVTIDADISYGPTAGIILVGIFGVGVSFGGILGWRRVVRGVYTGYDKYIQTTFLLTTYTLFVLLSLSITLYIHIRARPSNPANSFPALSDLYGHTLTGPYAVETWVCELSSLVNNHAVTDAAKGMGPGMGWVHGACSQARAARWCAIPVTGLAILLVGFCACLWWTERRAVIRRGREREAVGRAGASV